MKRDSRHPALALALSLAPLVGFAASPGQDLAAIEAARIVAFDITAQDLPNALNQLAQQGDIQIVFGDDVSASYRAKRKRPVSTP